MVIDIFNGNPAEGSVNKTSLTFITANWDTPQTVTITGVDDAIADGNIIYDVTLSINIGSSDSKFGAVLPQKVVVTNADNDSPGITVSGIDKHTKEDGTTATFTIVLNTQPTNDVTIPLISNNLEEGTIVVSSVTFNSTNWASVQTITVTGVNDALIDGNITYAIETGNASSVDINYNNLASADVEVVNDDDDAANFVLSKASGSTSESGLSDSFTIKLAAEPKFDVIINLSNSNPLEGILSPTQLTFNASNWNNPQMVTITGVDDAIDDGDKLYNIDISVDPSSDSKFTSVAAQSFNLINIDNDVAGITVSSISKNTTELGGQATFTIVLKSEPTANVTISLSSDDLSEGTVTPAFVTFVASNWNVPQTATVTGVDDVVVDGEVSFDIVTANSSSLDVAYNNLIVADVTVVNNDDEVVSFDLDKSTATTTEKGGSESFTLVLPVSPLTNVVFDIVSSNTSEGVVSVSQVVFTPANWNTPQTVTITGKDDLLPDGNVNYTVTISVNKPLSDAAFGTVTSQVINVTNNDDDSAGFTLSSISGSTSESGVTASFTIVLNSAPTADVVIALSSNNTNEGTLAISQLIFTPLNWNSAQTVTITGVDDAVVDGNVSYSIVTGDAVSADVNYNGLVVADVDVVNNDNDVTPDVVLNVSSIATSESGSSTDFTITLSTAPASDVVIDIVSSLTAEATVSSLQVTFTSTNWNNPQTITVTGVDDAVADGEVDYTITVSVNDALSDAAYSSVSDRIITGKNGDNEVAGVTISSISNATDENGATATFTIVLNTLPTDDVTISLSSSNSGEGTLTVSEVVFTTGNWNIPQTITVTGVDDAVVDGNANYTILLGAALSSDLSYQGIDATDVVVVNIDNEVGYTFDVSKSTLQTSESGSSDDFRVVLTSMPASDVVIDIISTNTAEGTLSTNQLTFTPAFWNIPQTVTVTGVDDAIGDGSIFYSITLSVNVALSDPNFASTPSVDVTVENKDNEFASVTVSPISNPTSEDGATATFVVVLDSKPTSDVIIPISVSD